jgi:hypothetical protein
MNWLFFFSGNSTCFLSEYSACCRYFDPCIQISSQNKQHLHSWHSHCEIKRGENFKQTFENSAKIDETIAKSKTTSYTPGLNKFELSQRFWVVVMIGDENDSMSMSTYSQKRMPIQIQAKPTTRLLFRTVTEESKLKTQKLMGISWLSSTHVAR